MIYRWQRKPSKTIDMLHVNYRDAEGRFHHYVYRVNRQPALMLSLVNNDAEYAQKVMLWFLENFDNDLQRGTFFERGFMAGEPPTKLEVFEYAI